jgi:hypothetical protein
VKEAVLARNYFGSLFYFKKISDLEIKIQKEKIFVN